MTKQALCSCGCLPEEIAVRVATLTIFGENKERSLMGYFCVDGSTREESLGTRLLIPRDTART